MSKPEDEHTPPVELEVKILEVDAKDVASKLEAAGARKILDAITHIEAFDYEGKVAPMDATQAPERFRSIFEAVQAITQGQHDLISAGAYLRLREEGDRCELILKSKAAGGTQQIKAETEISVPVQKAEWDEVRDTVLRTGLQRIIVQEKHRTSYVHKGIGARFDIDTWPQMPTYLEIEGSEQAIRRGVSLLGFSMDQTTSISGRDLFRKYGVDPRNLVFPPRRGQ